MTVPVPEEKVPELSQLPIKAIVPLVVCRVPALVTSPQTLRVQELTLNVDPDGTVMPAPQDVPAGRQAPETKEITAKTNVKELIREKMCILVGMNITTNSVVKNVSK